MGLHRSRRPADEQTSALARARMARLGGDIRYGGESRADDGLGVAPIESGRPSVDGSGFLAARLTGGEYDSPVDDEGAGGRTGDVDDDDRRAGIGDGDRRTEPWHGSFPAWLESVEDRLPLPLRRWRLGLERGHVAVVVLVAVLALAGAAIVLRIGRPEVVPVESEVTSSGTPVSPEVRPTEAPQEAGPTEAAPAGDRTSATEEAAPAPIVVHVAGLVVDPGVVELPAGSRVVDAVEAAGGPTAEADLTPINLARVLSDGEQVLVTSEPPEGAPPVAPPASRGHEPGPAPPGLVNLNTADADELDTLPGIGPALAQRILDWREQNGRFTAVDELREVSGIGEQRLADIEALVTL